MSCLDLKRSLLNTGGLPGGGVQWVAWSRVAAPGRLPRGGVQWVMWIQSHSERPLLTTQGVTWRRNGEGHFYLE